MRRKALKRARKKAEKTTEEGRGRFVVKAERRASEGEGNGIEAFEAECALHWRALK